MPVINNNPNIILPATAKTATPQATHRLPKLATTIFSQTAALSHLGRLSEKQFQVHLASRRGENLTPCQEESLPTKGLLGLHRIEALCAMHLFKHSVDDGKKALTPVSYLTTAEARDPYRLSFVDGKIYQNKTPLDTSQYSASFGQHGKAIFVASPGSREFFAGNSIVGKFHHSSFLAGGEVLGAGDLTTDVDGTLLGVSNMSGHYQPRQEHLLGTLSALAEKGVDLRGVNVREVDSTGSFRYDYSCAATYLESNGSCPPDSLKQLKERPQETPRTLKILLPVQTAEIVEDPAYREAPAQIEEDPAYRETPVQIAEDPAYREALVQIAEDPAYREASVQIAEDPAYREAPAQIEEDPAYREALVQIAEDPAYRESPAQIEEDPAYREALVQIAEDPAYRESPATHIFAQSAEVEADPAYN